MILVFLVPVGREPSAGEGSAPVPKDLLVILSWIVPEEIHVLYYHVVPELPVHILTTLGLSVSVRKERTGILPWGVLTSWEQEVL